MRANSVRSVRSRFFLAIFGVSATNAISATSITDIGRPISEFPTCQVEDASRKAHPPVYPEFLAKAGIKGTALIDVSLDRKASDATVGASATAEGDAHAEVGGLQANDVRVQRSTRNRDLDRIALETARKWRYVCPSSVPDAQRWARVEIAMDPAIAGSDETAPKRFAIEYFPSWLKEMLLQPSRSAAVRDDNLMPAGSIAEIAAHVQSDPAFKKDETPKPFAMYATWDDQTQTAQIWWLSNERAGRGNAVVLIRDDYRENTRTYAVRCESSVRVCRTFDQWLQSIIGTWYPMATWDAAPTGAK